MKILTFLESRSNSYVNMRHNQKVTHAQNRTSRDPRLNLILRFSLSKDLFLFFFTHEHERCSLFISLFSKKKYSNMCSKFFNRNKFSMIVSLAMLTYILIAPSIISRKLHACPAFPNVWARRPLCHFHGESV